MRLIIDGFNKSITKRDNQIVIKEDGKEVDYFLPKDLKQIIILGKGAITFDAIALLAESNVDLIAIDWRGNIKYRLASKDHNNVQIRKQQYQSLNDSRSGYLAKKFIESKIKNQKSLLGALSRNRGGIEFLDIQKNKLENLLKAVTDIKTRPSEKIRSQIFGVEGMASAEYWSGFKYVIGKDFDFINRSGRGAQDIVNSMLNYSYAILSSEILKSLHMSGLDPYAGFLHSDLYGRTSLVFDVMEEFRQQVVDRSILKIINRGQIDKDDFEIKDGFVYIGEDCRKLLVKTVLDKLNTDVTFDGIKKTYSDFIELESKNIVNFLMYQKQYKTFYIRW